MLVSGGFTFFTDRVRDRLKIDFTRSNVLEIEHGAPDRPLVDQPWGDICDGEEKRRMLLETCAALGVDPKQSFAVGDGANDLPMMAAAGLSVAYHAKPHVRDAAMVAIDEGGLDRLLEVFTESRGGGSICEARPGRLRFASAAGARMPIAQAASSATSRTAPWTTSRPSRSGPPSPRCCRRPVHGERAAAIDHEHASLPRLGDGIADLRVVLEALHRRDRAAELRSATVVAEDRRQDPQRVPADARCASHRSQVEKSWASLMSGPCRCGPLRLGLAAMAPIVVRLVITSASSTSG